MKSYFPIFIVLLLVSTSFVGISYRVEESSPLSYNGNTLYVGGSGEGNYTKIQDAIDDASDGDTVFVYDDSSPYHEKVIVDKSITLFGENRYTTIIDGRRKGDVISIIKDGVTINSFTITNGSTAFGSSAKGIKILSNHNSILYTIVMNNHFGIDCKSFSNNTFIGNIIENNGYGVSFDKSNNNLISENNFISNKHQHLGFSYSNTNTIKKNIFEYESKNGIRLYNANNIDITDNSFYHCGISFDYSTFSNLSNNTVNGKPLIYMVGESNKIIKEAGQIILKDCNNITIHNLELSNVCVSIISQNTSNCLIADNVLNHTAGGIYLRKFSSNNIIRNNVISNCSSSIRLSENRNNIVEDNKIYRGGWIDVYRCTNISIVNNSIIKGGWGVYLQYSNYCNISSNLISQGSQGIYFEESEFNVISNNDISMMSNGIRLDFSSKHNNILNNNFSDNDAGLLLKDDSKYNTIINNFFTNNGVILSNTRNNIFLNNSVNDKPLIYIEEESEKIIDADAGQIILVSCYNITIQKQKICNTTVGIELLNSDNCKITQNTIGSNNIYGILIEKSKTNIINNNIISNNDEGIFLDYDSKRNTITDNSFSDNIYGITISYSRYNTISKNNFLNNKRHAYFENSWINIWRKNYWNGPRILPKIIFGKGWADSIWFGNLWIDDIWLPWINIDWRPAQEPYDIEV